MASSTRLRIKVVPGASRTEVAGWLNDELKIRVAAPPGKGKANTSLLELLARAAGVPVRNLSIEQGTISTHKLVRIDGIDRASLLARLAT
ncbi:MAG: DUF167 domain-containing protein [Pseudomonadales bacterium]|nr:DUF167 domain-containing protein [Pseudomonadales bacterium]MDP6469882.1 DUF167 domain-containing protein [Pseudomonadales bacterium]MDP6827515.1 DUF167 domain-containing protein [Pseudomonadales bacterium]MDP6971352.1 DUF167 domain-containing protein [Pseudomonadales bacterium]